jgi:hypothetical protein
MKSFLVNTVFSTILWVMFNFWIRYVLKSLQNSTKCHITKLNNFFFLQFNKVVLYQLEWFLSIRFHGMIIIFKYTSKAVKFQNWIWPFKIIKQLSICGMPIGLHPKKYQCIKCSAVILMMLFTQTYVFKRKKIIAYPSARAGGSIWNFCLGTTCWHTCEPLIEMWRTSRQVSYM